MSTKLALITVVYQNYDVLNDFFDSLKKQTKKDFHLYIADLSTSKKTISSSIPLTVMAGKNKGYGYGVNIGLNEAVRNNCTQFAIINSDVVMDEDFVTNTLNALESHPTSLVGGKIYYEKGYEYHQDRYKPKNLGKVLWYAGGTVDWKNVYIKHEGVDEVDKGQYDEPRSTHFITGCCIAFNKNSYDTIGGWDEKYFLYYEDADFCERAKRAGISLYYDPKIILWHKNAQSTGGSGSSIHTHYQRINRIRFGMKYAPFKTKLFLIRDYLLKHPSS